MTLFLCGSQHGPLFPRTAGTGGEHFLLLQVSELSEGLSPLLKSLSWRAEAAGSPRSMASLGYIVNSKPVWATIDAVSNE